MRKTALVLFFAVITVFVAACIYADCGNMKGDKDPKSGGQCSMMMDEANCPFCVKGAVVKVVNTKDGIQVLVTAADKSAIKEIQEKGGKFMKACGEKTESSITPKNGVTEAKLEGNPNDTVQCPVMGTKLKKKDAVEILAYKGKTYYICCRMCIDKFVNDPGKYAK